MNFLHRQQATKIDSDATVQSLSDTVPENGSMQDLFSGVLGLNSVPNTFALDAEAVPSNEPDDGECKMGLSTTEYSIVVDLLAQIPLPLKDPLNNLSDFNSTKKCDFAQVGTLTGTAQSDYLLSEAMKQSEQQPVRSAIYNSLVDGNRDLQCDSKLPVLPDAATPGKLSKVTFVQQPQPVPPIEFQRLGVAEGVTHKDVAARNHVTNLSIYHVDLANSPTGLLEFANFSGANTSVVANEGKDIPPTHLVRVNASLTVNVVKQVVDSLISAKDKIIEIRLDPPELGKLRLIMEISAATVQVVISSERAELLDLMRRNSETLTREFISQGFSNVQLEFQSRGNNFREHRKLGKTSDQISQSLTSDLEILPDSSSQLNMTVGLDRLDLRF